MPDMAEKLGVGTGVRELKIGQSFFNQQKSGAHNRKSGSSRNGASGSFDGDQDSSEKSFHSIRYDFKPASSNTSSTGFLDVDEDNRVSVKIQHEGSGQTNFSGHQKEANAKDCLLIIDHVTGEITLEKLSSQIMVKKTRSEKPGSKLDDIVLPTPSSRPHTPNNFPKHDSYKSNVNKKVASEHKPGRVNHVNSPNHTKNVTTLNDHTASNIKSKGGDNLSSASSSDSSSDSDSDSDSQSNAKPTDTSTRPVQSGFSGKPKPPSKSMSGAATVLDKPTYKTSNQSSPSRPRTHSPKQQTFENKQTHSTQSKVKSTPAPAPATSTFTGLNDDFDDSDDSDNEMSNTRKDAGQDYSLGRFTPTRTSQTARSVPNFSNFETDFTSAPESKKPESKPSSKNKPGQNAHSSGSSSAVSSMPQFLNDDLELSESDSDS